MDHTNKQQTDKRILALVVAVLFSPVFTAVGVAWEQYPEATQKRAPRIEFGQPEILELGEQQVDGDAEPPLKLEQLPVVGKPVATRRKKQAAHYCWHQRLSIGSGSVQVCDRKPRSR